MLKPKSPRKNSPSKLTKPIEISQNLILKIIEPHEPVPRVISKFFQSNNNDDLKFESIDKIANENINIENNLDDASETIIQKPSLELQSLVDNKVSNLDSFRYSSNKSNFSLKRSYGGHFKDELPINSIDTIESLDITPPLVKTVFPPFLDIEQFKFKRK